MRCRPGRVSKSMSESAIPWTLHSGKVRSRESPPGTARGGRGGRAGILSAPPWRSAIWARHSTFMEEERISSFLTTRTKSLGNFFTIREIFEKFPASAPVTAEILRFFLLSTHYRSPIDFSDEALRQARAGLNNFYDLFK